MKERIGYVDATKGLGMLLIMFGHVTEYDNPVDLWMSSFKVVIFYIMSGFLMSYSGSIKKRSFGVFMKKTFISLAVPYISFSILGIMFKVGCVYVKMKPMSKITKVFWEYLWDSVFLAGINSMWFLPTIFFGEIIFFFLIRAPKIIKLLYAVAGLYVITAVNNIIDYVGTSMQGRMDQISIDNISNLISAVGKGFMAAWFIGAGYIIYIFYQKIKDDRIKLLGGLGLSILNVLLSQLNSHIDIHMLKEGEKPALFYICGIIGSLGAIMLLDFLSERFNLSGLDFWGKNSLAVMCTHTVFGLRSVAYFGWQKVSYFPSVGSTKYVCQCLVAMAILMMIEYSLVLIINSKLWFLLGKKKSQIVS